MDLTELIEKLRILPEDKQIEVFDFVEFLVNRNSVKTDTEKTLASSSLVECMKHPLTINEFKPFIRDEAHDR